jgi:hypothetical protein
MIAILVGIVGGATGGLAWAGACACAKAELANPKTSVVRTTKLFFKLKLLNLRILP